MPDITPDLLDPLLRYCDGFAKQMLTRSGAFYPFAAYINQDGKIEAVGASTGEERPRPSELYELLQGALSARAADGTAKAYAIAVDVNIPAHLGAPFSDGIRVHVQAQGVSRQIYTPYRLLPHRSIRKFLRFLPTVEYARPISVDLDELG